MLAAEVIVHEVKLQRVQVLLILFRVCVRQAGEAAHSHPHREVLALDVGRGSFAQIGLAALRFLLDANALQRRVTVLASGFHVGLDFDD